MTAWFNHHNPASYQPALRRGRRVNLDTRPAPTVLASGIDGCCLSHYWLSSDAAPLTSCAVDAEPDEWRHAMAVWLHREGHGYFGGDRTNLNRQPAPTITATGIGTFQWHVESDTEPLTGCAVETEEAMRRIWMERDTALPLREGAGRRFPGSPREWVDVTDRPSPTILIGRGARPRILVEEDGMPDDAVITARTGSHFVRQAWPVNKPTPTIGAAEAMMRAEVAAPLPPDDLADAPAMPADGSKPPYRVPLVAETREQPRNGLKVVSTFSGAGGSSYGYQLAGYEVVWVNDIVQAARDCYRANHKDTIVDGRDIRDVSADDILDACGLEPGDLDLFDGSPPCQSFSTAGKREKGWGRRTVHGDGTTQVADDLFFEYARLVDGLRPRVFVAENVSGLVKGKAKGYFKLILRELKGCGYRVSARLLDAQWLGVPQARQRVIFVGVRDDLEVDPVHPDPLPYRYSVRDALPWITRHGTAPNHAEWAGHKDVEKTMVSSAAHPAPTVTGLRGHDKGSGWAEGDTIERRRFTIAELKRICSFPDDYVLTGSYSEQWARLGNSVPPVMMFHVAAAIRDRILLPAAASG